MLDRLDERQTKLSFLAVAVWLVEPEQDGLQQRTAGAKLGARQPDDAQ